MNAVKLKISTAKQQSNFVSCICYDFDVFFVDNTISEHLFFFETKIPLNIFEIQATHQKQAQVYTIFYIFL